MPETPPANLVANSWTQALTPPESVPASADVVIVGAGIVGISTAWFLARLGIKVVVCEKGLVAGEQSSRNWGWVRQQGRDTREMPIIVESLGIWRGLADEIGEDVGFSEQGILYAFDNSSEGDSYADWLRSVAEYDLDSRLVDGRELKSLVPDSTRNWMGALYTASDGRAEPHKAVPALARAVVREGATVLTSCAVRGIQTEAGRVASVTTEHGKIRTSVVLCAAGAWTSMFCRSLGIDLPQLKVRGTVARTAPCHSVFGGSISDKKLAIRRRQDGGYTIANSVICDYPVTPATFRYGWKFLRAFMMDPTAVRPYLGAEFREEFATPRTWSLDSQSPFEKCRVLNPQPNDKHLRAMRKNLDEIFPGLADTPIVETWAGMIDATPDAIPVIDQADSLPGFYIATGFSGHGFGIGPGAGKAIAALLTGNDVGLDVTEFQLGRFFDGSPIRPQHSV